MFEIWTEFKQNIENFRLQVPEFNSLFVDKKTQKKHIKSKKQELYSTLFMIISLADLKMHNSIKKYMDHHRIKLIQSQSGIFSKNFIQYIISLKNQQREILRSTSDMLEHFAFQFFELLDESDFHDYTRLLRDSLVRKHQLSQSPYSLLRDLSKRSKIHNEDFTKYHWRDVNLMRQELMLQKGPIEISAKPKNKNTIKNHDVKDHLRQILRKRWNIEAKPQKIFKVDKPKKKTQKLKLKERKLQKENQENSIQQPIVLESAFDIIHMNERSSVPDIVLEDLLTDQTMQREQSLFKIQDSMPYLSVIEKNCQFFVSF